MEHVTAAVQAVDPLDLIAVAIDILQALELMRPVPIPAAPVPSAELAALLDHRQPVSVPQHMGAEFALYDAGIQRRYRARSENERRIGVTLWAEQYLREHGRAEHKTLREFNRKHWGVAEPASADIALRYAQARSSL